MRWIDSILLFLLVITVYGIKGVLVKMYCYGVGGNR